MPEQILKPKSLFVIAIAISSIGAFGQAYLLYHELVNSYPYKMMDVELYRTIAKFGICLAPTTAIILGLLFGRKRLWLIVITPVILCPLFFFFVFKATSIVRSELSGIDGATWHFDGKNSSVVAQEFLLYTLGLSIVGLIVGGVFSLILSYLSKQRKFA